MDWFWYEVEADLVRTQDHALESIFLILKYTIWISFYRVQ